MVRGFAKGAEDQGSIPGRVIPETQKMVHDASLLNTQHYKVQIKDKWRNHEKGVVLSPTSQCSSYWKGSLWVTLNYVHPTYVCLVLNEWITASQ